VLREVPLEERPACPYGECDGSTWILDEETNDARPCRCREQRVRRAVSGGIGTGIGRRFLEVSFDREPIVSLDRAVLRQVRAFTRTVEENLEAGRGLWFDGPVGTGKTSLAILVAKAARDSGHSYAFYTVPRLLVDIRRTYDRDASDSYLTLMRRLCSVDLLVLDDLGAERQTEWVVEQLYSVVNERWQDKRSIVVTTNIGQPDQRAAVYPLRDTVKKLREAAKDGPANERYLAEVRELIERAEGLIHAALEIDPPQEFNPVARLSPEIGGRTVSRLVEICDGHIPVLGPDLRMTVQDAYA
jgi:DNA replication protein DnaC